MSLRVSQELDIAFSEPETVDRLNGGVELGGFIVEGVCRTIIVEGDVLVSL